MKKSNKKSFKAGFEVRLNYSGEKGLDNWNRVGGLFNSVQDAEAFKLSRFPKVKKYIILGINLDTASNIGEK